MTNSPTGRLERTPGGGDLVVTRVFRAAVEDVWASITEPERTARWFGPWEGAVRPQLAWQTEQLLEGDPIFEAACD